MVYRIFDVEGKRRDIDVSKVASVQVSEVLLMPEGLATSLELSTVYHVDLWDAKFPSDGSRAR